MARKDLQRHRRRPRLDPAARAGAACAAPLTRERLLPVALAYDPRLPAEIADPFPTFARLRADDPVHRSEVLGGWVLTRYDDCRAALNDKRFSADRITPFRDHLQPSARAQIVDLLRVLGLWAVFTEIGRAHV